MVHVVDFILANISNYSYKRHSMHSYTLIKSVDVRKLGKCESMWKNKITTLSDLGYLENITVKMSSEFQIRN